MQHDLRAVQTLHFPLLEYPNNFHLQRNEAWHLLFRPHYKRAAQKIKTKSNSELAMGELEWDSKQLLSNSHKEITKHKQQQITNKNKNAKSGQRKILNTAHTCKKCRKYETKVKNLPSLLTVVVSIVVYLFVFGNWTKNKIKAGYCKWK